MAAEHTGTQDRRAALVRLRVRLASRLGWTRCRGAGLPLSTAATMDGYGWCPYGEHTARVKNARRGGYRVLKGHPA